MDFFELTQHRRSSRAYENRPVEKDKLERCVEAARLAPSACNSQPWKFIIVDDHDLRASVASETFGKFISFNHFSLTAPVLVVIVAENPNITAGIGAIWKDKPYYLMDIGIAAEHFCLQATEEGLGSCMLGWFKEKALKKLLKIPVVKRVPLVITVGYPADSGNYTKQRKPIEKILSFNQY